MNDDKFKIEEGLKRKLFLVLGYISLGLAIIGIFIPLLPTTPLLLLACFAFLRSSKYMYKWIINNKYLGPYISNYEKKQMKRGDKIFTLAILWIGIAISIYFIPFNWVKILLLLIASGVTTHLLTLKSV